MDLLSLESKSNTEETKIIMIDFKTPPLWINSIYYRVSYRRVYKSASTSITSMLWQSNEGNKPAYLKRFTVIREPFARLQSIYNQVKRNGDTSENITSFLERIKSEGFRDPHELPQTWFIQDCENLTFFTLEQMKEVVNFIGCFDKKQHFHNQSKTRPELSKKDKALIEEIYHEDFKLYNKIKTTCHSK